MMRSAQSIRYYRFFESIPLHINLFSISLGVLGIYYAHFSEM